MLSTPRGNRANRPLDEQDSAFLCCLSWLTHGRKTHYVFGIFVFLYMTVSISNNKFPRGILFSVDGNNKTSFNNNKGNNNDNPSNQQERRREKELYDKQFQVLNESNFLGGAKINTTQKKSYKSFFPSSRIKGQQQQQAKSTKGGAVSNKKKNNFKSFNAKKKKKKTKISRKSVKRSTIKGSPSNNKKLPGKSTKTQTKTSSNNNAAKNQSWDNNNNKKRLTVKTKNKQIMKIANKINNKTPESNISSNKLQTIATQNQSNSNDDNDDKNDDSSDTTESSLQDEEPYHDDASTKEIKVLRDRAILPLPKQQPVPIRFLSGAPLTAVTRFLLDGVERSSVLQLESIWALEPFENKATQVFVNTSVSTTTTTPLVYMVDFGSLGRDCHFVTTLMKHIAENTTTTKQQQQRFSPGQLILIDYTGSLKIVSCDNLWKETSSNNDPSDTIVWVAKRSLVQGRHWDAHINWIQPGHVVSASDPSLQNVVHAPYPIRESFLALLRIHSKERLAMQQDNDNKNVALANEKEWSPVDLLNRTIDVLHAWPEGDVGHYGFFRRRVSSIITKLEGTTIKSTFNSSTSLKQQQEQEEQEPLVIKTVVERLGVGPALDVNLIHRRYVEGLLDSKIVIVAQRDEWEDHYRLLESMASGALVMTDTMLSLPEGLVHGQHLVVYNTSSQLRRLVQHYLDPNHATERLRVARSGWEWIMGRHRVWHGVERILFGRPLTAVDEPYRAAPSRQRRRSSPPQSIRGTFDLVERVVDQDQEELASKELEKVRERQQQVY